MQPVISADMRVAAVKAGKGKEASPSSYEPDSAWPPEHCAVIQRLFGEGFTSPGGAEAVQEMLNPLGVNETMTLAFIGGGLGGPGRLIASKSNAWVTSYVGDEEQAAAGQELSVMAGLGRKAIVQCADFENLDLAENSVNCVLAKEKFFLIEDKPAFFTGLCRILRDHGQIMYTDYLKAAPDTDGQAFRKWLAHEPVTPHPLDLTATKAFLEDAGLEVRVSLDITAEFCKRLVLDFRTLVQSLKDKPLSPGEKYWVLKEAEVWLHRAAAIDSGDLKVYRIYALLKEMRDFEDPHGD